MIAAIVALNDELLSPAVASIGGLAAIRDCTLRPEALYSLPLEREPKRFRFHPTLCFAIVEVSQSSCSHWITHWNERNKVQLNIPSLLQFVAQIIKTGNPVVFEYSSSLYTAWIYTFGSTSLHTFATSPVKTIYFMILPMILFCLISTYSICLHTFWMLLWTSAN